MLCPSCGHENRAERKFCAQCGEALTIACPACSVRNEPGEKFCGGCGQALNPPAPASRTPTPTPTPQPSPALPASFAGGRYRVQRFLGEGGRKRVYLAHDTKLDRDVAIAVIKTEGLDATGMSRVQREAQAMGRLGDHPHIVTIHDVGESDGRPYIVSQYMAGGAVDALEHPISLEQTLEIAKGVCKGLEHAHASGVVHRDLKPGNVWLSADATPKIGDFGLAVALDRSRLTMQGMLVGTVAYMAPEQALGGETTAQADLYALGCTLYELVTGRPPFLGSDPTAVISQHINQPPVAPSWLTESCPPELEEVILRLLAKDPGERPENAGAVLAVLERVDPAQKSASHSESNVLDRLARGVFVGRQKELERLRQAFDGAYAGRGGLVMLVGEPGIGKTRTTQELETYARMRGAQVLWGRAHESAGAPPYWPWLQAGNQYATANMDGLGAIGAQMPPGAVGELSRIFPWLRTLPDFVKPEEFSDPEVAQFRLFDAYTSYLRAIASQVPLLVALDDLHWADKPTLQLLQHVARELSRMRVLIAGNYRDTDITRQSALSETLASLKRESGFDRIVLRGLTRDEVADYIRARANIEPKTQVLERIYDETEGNAFFLSEVVNLMAEEGTLTKDSISDIAIPDGVREALGRRLNRLSDETNELLQVAAIIGREFTYDTLTLLGGRDEDELLRLIEEALEARVIEETEQAGRYRFTHAQMQETLLAELSTTRRVRLHGQVGEALERRYGDRAEERPARLALHFSEAATLAPRFTEKAARYSALAGCQALAQSAYSDAVRHFRAALSAREGQAVDDEMAELLFDFGVACRSTLQAKDAWRAFRQAFDYFSHTGNVARAVDVAELVGSGAEFVALTQTRMIERCLELVEEGSAEQCRLKAALGYSTGMMGDDERAQEAFARARDIARRLGAPYLELRCLLREMFVDAFYWRPRETLAKAERAVDLARELGESASEILPHSAAAYVAHALGEINRARQHADDCRLLAERSRTWGLIAQATYVQAFCAISRGDWQSAREALSRGLEVAPEDVRLPGEMSYVAALTGDLAAADEHLERLIAINDSRPPGAPRIMSAACEAWALPIHGYLTGRPSDPAAVERCAREVLSSTAPLLLVGAAQAGRAMQAVTDGDPNTARECLAALEMFAGTLTEVLAWDHIRGLLFFTLGRMDEAVDAVEDALRLLATGYEPSYAWAARDCARIRLQRATPGDRERARALIGESLALAQKLGMKPLIDRVLALKLEEQGISSANVYTSIDRVATAVQSEHPDLRRQAAPDGTVTIMFTDIENSTPLNETMGDAKWMELLHEHNAVVEGEVKTHGGKVVKNRGDGYMLIFRRPDRGLDCAVAIQQALAGHEVIRVRIGLHIGNPVREGEDFFGTDVNLAARVADAAIGGGVFVSGRLHDLLKDEHADRFGEPVEIELKGLAGAQRVYAVVGAEHAE